jgi:tripartite-type tricarboxylate transporter receptor subunit TctC
MRRFIFIGCVVSAVYALGSVASTLQAQPYPHRPIQLVIPMGPGAGTDLNGRFLAEELKKILKTEIFVVNKPGASQTSGTDFVVKSKKDGYTLLYAGGAAIIAKAIEPETVPYDPLMDLEPLGLHAFFPVVIAVPENAPWKTFNDFLDDAKKTPARLRISSPGLQTHSSFNLVIIESLTGTKFTQVPFKEGMAAITNMLGGHVEATCISMSMVLPFVNQGKARILLTSKKMMEFPKIPVLNELGYKQELPSPWFAMYGPAGIPEEVKKVLVPAIKEAIHHPDVTARINKIGGTVIDYKSPEELKKITAEELEAISAIAIKIGLRK